MMQQFRQGEEAMLMISATDRGGRSSSPTGRSEWRTGRKVVVGALAMTLGALALGLVSASRTQPAGAVRTDVLPAAPSPATHSSVPKAGVARRLTAQVPNAPSALINKRQQTASRVGDDALRQKGTLFFTRQGFTFGFAEYQPTRGVIRNIARDQESIAGSGVSSFLRRVITLAFIDANPDVTLHWQPVPETITPFTDPQSLEKIETSGAPTLQYREIWPGIDLLYTVSDNRLRSTFLVKPGADPNQIQFAYHGVVAVKRIEAGELEISTPMGSLIEETPAAYQESLHLARLAGLRDGVSIEMRGGDRNRDEQRVGVAVAYTLQPSGDTWVWGIHVGAYDPNTPLIIDLVIRYPGSIGASNVHRDADLTADTD